MIIGRSRAAASGGWTPTSVAGLQYWYDFSNSSSLTLSGSNIQTVNDLSGNSRTGTGSASNPTLVTGAQNGLSVASFVFSNSQKFTLASPYTPADFTCLAVMKPTTNRPSVALSSTANTNAYGIVYYTDNTVYSRGQSGMWQASAGSYAGAFHLFSVKNSSSGQFYVDQSTITTSSGGSGATGSIDNIGVYAGLYSNCQIGEILFYSSALGATDFNAASSYLKAKWGTP